MSSYNDNLILKVINNSESNNWQDAVHEWEIVDCYEDETLLSSCICGKECIKYCYTIKNNNGNELVPIGSRCINKFDRQDLNDFTTVHEKLFSLLHAIRDNKFITLSSEYFSRKLIEYLYQNGAFQPSIYNDNTPIKDYNFLIKMFNQKKPPSQQQQKKINALIINNIRPYLENIIGDKIIY